MRLGIVVGWVVTFGCLPAQEDSREVDPAAMRRAMDKVLASLPECTASAGSGSGKLDLESACIDEVCVGITVEELEEAGVDVRCTHRTRFRLEYERRGYEGDDHEWESDWVDYLCDIDDGSTTYPGWIASNDLEAETPGAADVLKRIVLVEDHPDPHTTPQGLGPGVEVSCFLDAGHRPTSMRVDARSQAVTSIDFGTFTMLVSEDGSVRSLVL